MSTLHLHPSAQPSSTEMTKATSLLQPRMHRHRYRSGPTKAKPGNLIDPAQHQAGVIGMTLEEWGTVPRQPVVLERQWALICLLPVCCPAVGSEGGRSLASVHSSPAGLLSVFSSAKDEGVETDDGPWLHLRPSASTSRKPPPALPGWDVSKNEACRIGQMGAGS